MRLRRSHDAFFLTFSPTTKAKKASRSLQNGSGCGNAKITKTAAATRSPEDSKARNNDSSYQYTTKGTALAVPFVVYSTIQWPILSHILEICFQISMEHQVCIPDRIIVNQIVQLRPFVHISGHLVLHGGTIYGVYTPVCKPLLHTPGVHIERTTDSLFHDHILLFQIAFFFLGPLGLEFGRLITPFRKCVSSNFSKKTNNPNPSPIKKIWFGLFWSV